MKKILAIDNKQDSLISIKAQINSIFPDAEVLTSQSGKEGLYFAREHKPDVILMDSLILEMDGYSFFNELKGNKKTKHIPLIMLFDEETGSESREKGLEKGVDAFLMKPIDFAELIAEIKVMLRLKSAEDKLRQEKMVSDKIVETANAIIVGLDKDHLIRIFNRGAEKITGYKKEEVIGKDWFKIFLSDDILDEMNEVWKEAWGIKYHSYINPIIIKTGEVRIVSWQTTGIYDSNDASEHLQISIGEDITDRKLAEEKLKESEARYSFINENSMDSIWVMDADLRFTYLSPSTVDLFGYSLEEWQNLDWNDFVHPKYMQIVINAFNKLKTDKENVMKPVSTIVRHKDGTEMWVEFSAKAIYDENKRFSRAVGISRDITQRKLAEEKLRESEKLMRKIAENYPNSYISIIEKDHSIGFTSGQEFKNQNLNPDDFIGLSIEQVFGENTEIVRNYYNKTFKGESQSFELFINNQYQHYRTVPLYSEDGTIQRIMSFVENITERKQFVKTIQERNEYIESIMANMPIGFAVNTIEDGEVKFINKKFEEFYGWPSEVLTNISIFFEKVFPDPEYRAKVKSKILSDMQSGDPDRMKWYGLEITTSKGEVRFVNAINIPLFDQNLMISTVQDVTERIKAENKLLESEDRFRSLVDTVNSGVAIYKVINEGVSGSDYIIQDFNQFALKHEKMKKEDVVGKSLKDIRPNIDDYGLIDVFRKVWETGEPTFFPAKVYVDENYSNYYENRVFKLPSGEIVAVYDDVTKREIAELALKESEERFKLAMDASNDGLFDWDLKTNAIYYSPGWKKLIGYEDHELPNDFSIWENTTDPQDVKKSWELQQKLISKQIDRFVLEFKMKHKDGHWVDILSRAKAIFDDNGEAIRIVGNHTDISERKKAEEELHKHREHLEELVRERTEKLQASIKELEAFSYSVSHDLRAPLRAIAGFTRILMEDYVENLDEEGKNIGNVIQNNAEKMGKLIDDLLTFSRLGRASMQFSKIDMKSMAMEVYNESTSSSERERISFSVEDLPKAEGDISMLRQVWMNLISNAVKFSSKREKAVISVTGFQDEDKVTYRISDNGAGLDMRYKSKIFEVFQRLHSELEFPGTGVGMALVKRIINRHEGNIWVESEEDKGATFYFSLPKRIKGI